MTNESKMLKVEKVNRRIKATLVVVTAMLVTFIRCMW